MTTLSASISVSAAAEYAGFEAPMGRRCKVASLPQDKTQQTAQEAVQAAVPHKVRNLAEATDKELVKRVQKGDLAAFDMLFARYQSKILNLISRYVRDSEEVQDVAQEAFIKAYRALPRFRGDSAFYTWLYRIAINTAKNHLVARSRRPPSTDVDVDDADFRDDADILREMEDPEAALARDQLRETIHAALNDLPDDLRSALTLREFDGLSYEQIAEILECPVGTVRSRIFRAREFVDQRMQPVLTSRSDVE